eukprot:gene34093-biopygen11784
MAQHLREAHKPIDYYQGMDLTAFGCATCPTCEVAYRQERSVDPVIPEASCVGVALGSPTLGVVEAECWWMPVASGPGCPQLRFEHLDAVYGAGDGVAAIQHACEQIVSNKIPAGIQPWIMGARNLRRRGGWARGHTGGSVRVVVMFLAIKELLPHLGAPEGIESGGHPLVAGFVSAMEDVRGAKERVLAARADGHVLPEALKLSITLPLVREVSAVGTGRCRCGGVVDEFGYHYLACNRMSMFIYRHDAVQDVLVEMLRKVFDPASVKKTHAYPYHHSISPRCRCILHYGDVTPHRLVPFAVETFGGLGEQAKDEVGG